MPKITTFPFVFVTFYTTTMHIFENKCIITVSWCIILHIGCNTANTFCMVAILYRLTIDLTQKRVKTKSKVLSFAFQKKTTPLYYNSVLNFFQGFWVNL